jgi:BASS family bile acid:Na+ symporter
MTETFLVITRLSVLVFLVSSLSGVGLGLTLQQVVAPLRNAKLVIFAVVANFIIAPALAVGIGRLLRLDEPFALGLLLLGLAAGAPFLPKIVAIAKGDLALSVGLMVLLMVGTTVLLPVALPRLVEGVQVNPWKIARFLTLLLLLPLVAGLIVKARWESIASRLRPVLERVSAVSFLAMLVLILAINFKAVLRIFGTGAILAAILFAVLAALAGRLLGGREAAQRTVLGLATGLRNIPAALIVSTQNFKDPNVSVMVIVTTLTGILILLPAARLLGKRATAISPVNKIVASNSTHDPHE